jgi:hypothetical protein
MEKHNKCMILNGYSKHQMNYLDPLNMIFFVFKIVILFRDSNEIPKKTTFGNFAKFKQKGNKQTHMLRETFNMPKNPKEPQRLVSHTNQTKKLKIPPNLSIILD